jgi:hypothetical protein
MSTSPLLHVFIGISPFDHFRIIADEMCLIYWNWFKSYIQTCCSVTMFALGAAISTSDPVTYRFTQYPRSRAGGLSSARSSGPSGMNLFNKSDFPSGDSSVQASSIPQDTRCEHWLPLHLWAFGWPWQNGQTWAAAVMPPDSTASLLSASHKSQANSVFQTHWGCWGTEWYHANVKLWFKYYPYPGWLLDGWEQCLLW